MSGTRSVTLKPGDLVYWVPPEDAENVEPSVAAVSDDGTELMFQFGPRPWSQYPHPGPTVAEAEEILNGKREFDLPGRIWKCYDAAHDRGLIDPTLLDPGEDVRYK